MVICSVITVCVGVKHALGIHGDAKPNKGLNEMHTINAAVYVTAKIAHLVTKDDTGGNHNPVSGPDLLLFVMSITYLSTSLNTTLLPPTPSASLLRNRSCVTCYALAVAYFLFLPPLVTIHRPGYPLPVHVLAVFLLTPLLLPISLTSPPQKDRSHRRALSVTEAAGTYSWFDDGLTPTSAGVVCVNLALLFASLYKLLLRGSPLATWIASTPQVGCKRTIYDYLYPDSSSVPLLPSEITHVRTTLRLYGMLESSGLWTSGGLVGGFAANVVGVACCLPVLLVVARTYAGLKPTSEAVARALEPPFGYGQEAVKMYLPLLLVPLLTGGNGVLELKVLAGILMGEGCWVAWGMQTKGRGKWGKVL
jgi:hypothetical protein